jgi:hypothetical protein
MANFHRKLLASQEQLVDGVVPNQRAPDGKEETLGRDLLDTQTIMEECWTAYFTKAKTINAKGMYQQTLNGVRERF